MGSGPQQGEISRNPQGTPCSHLPRAVPAEGTGHLPSPPIPLAGLRCKGDRGHLSLLEPRAGGGRGGDGASGSVRQRGMTQGSEVIPKVRASITSSPPTLPPGSVEHSPPRRVTACGTNDSLGAHKDGKFGAARGRAGTPGGSISPAEPRLLPRWLRSQAQTSPPPPPRPPRALRAAAPAGREVSAAPAAAHPEPLAAAAGGAGQPRVSHTHTLTYTHTKPSLSCRSLSVPWPRFLRLFSTPASLSPAHSRWFSPPPEAAPPPPFRLPSSFSFCLIK